MDWSLSEVLISMHYEVEGELAKARTVLKHPGTKGDASQAVWVDLFSKYLPRRYACASVHIADSIGHFSEQIDVAIYDRQYSPFILSFKGQQIVPAESVYAVFEAKQTVNSGLIQYAKKEGSLGSSIGTYQPPYSDRRWNTSSEGTWTNHRRHSRSRQRLETPLGKSFQKALSAKVNTNRLDIGCIAAHGWFGRSGDERWYRFFGQGYKWISARA